MSVYFIKNERTGSYKIGHSISPECRLQELQTANEDNLILDCAIYNVGVYTERNLHARWKDLRIRGEWYQPNEDMLEFIATARDHWNAYKHSGPVGADTHSWFQRQMLEDPEYKKWSEAWSRSIERSLNDRADS